MKGQRWMKSVVCSVFCALALDANSLAQDQKAMFRERINLESGSYRGYAELDVKDPVLRRGQEFTTQITFHNTGGGAYFFNPLFNRLIDLPAQLAIFDSQKEYIGNLLYREVGSIRTPGPYDWTYILGGSVRKNIKRMAGYVPGTKYNSTGSLLPPGTYYIQMIYYGVFLRPYHEGLKYEQQIDEWKASDKKELFRSNVVKIDLVDN
jgi:hypothetical protein